jgi:hypothetical protein
MSQGDVRNDATGAGESVMSPSDDTASVSSVTSGSNATRTASPSPEHSANAVPPVSTDHSAGRTAAVWVLIVVSCLLVVLSTLTVGVQQLLLNTDRWVATVGPLASNATVQSSLADTAAMLTLNALDLHGRAASLPAPLQSVAAPIEAAIASFVDDQALKLVESPQFPVLWTDLNQTVHPVLVRMLRGETPPGGAVTVNDGAVQVNAAVLVPAVLERIAQVAPDVLAGQLPAAVANGAAAPGQLQQRIAEAVGRQLPPDFGHITLMQSSTLATAQRAVQILDNATWLLVVAAVIAIVAALFLSADRGLTTLRLGIGVGLGMLIAGALLYAAQNTMMAALAGQPLSGAVQTALAAAIGSLAQFMFVVFLVSVAVAALAFVARRRSASPARASGS